jgi:hypothetical protein
MNEHDDIEQFLALYNEQICKQAHELRKLVMANLPHCTEQLDAPAKIIAYTYGPKYVDIICVIIPSKKGLKLGFNRGIELADPKGLLRGTGKVSRYLKITQETKPKVMKQFLKAGLKLYKEKIAP